MSFSLVRVASRFPTHHVKWLAKKRRKRILIAFGALALVGRFKAVNLWVGCPEAKLQCDCQRNSVDAHINIEQKTYLIKV